MGTKKENLKTNRIRKRETKRDSEWDKRYEREKYSKVTGYITHRK